MISVSIRQEGRSIPDCPKWRPFRTAHRSLASPGFPCTGLVATVKADGSVVSVHCMGSVEPFEAQTRYLIRRCPSSYPGSEGRVELFWVDKGCEAHSVIADEAKEDDGSVWRNEHGILVIAARDGTRWRFDETRECASPMGFNWSSEGCGLSWEDVSERISEPLIKEASA